MLLYLLLVNLLAKWNDKFSAFVLSLRLSDVKDIGNRNTAINHFRSG
jgi:hypothetical protein